MPTAPHAAPLAGLALRCQPDSRLVTLSREGQERAFEEIVRRYRDSLVSFAGAIVPTHRAEDVVQEALAKAHTSLLVSTGEVKLRPWLYTIVRNRALNDLRDEPGHMHLAEDFDGVPQPPEVAAERAELASVLSRVRGLPPAQREALVKRELEGRSHEEIASMLGATPGAVRALIFRARTALRSGAGMLIPMPAVRALLDAGPMQAGSAGAGVGGAAAGLTAGGGGGIAVKAGATLLVAGLAVGSGVAIQNQHHRSDATAATVVQRGDSRPGHGRGDGAGTPATGSHPGSQSGGDASSRGPGPGGDSGNGPSHGSRGSTSGPGPSGRGSGSGPGGGDHGSSGTGGREGDGSGDGSHHGGGETGGDHGGSGGTSGSSDDPGASSGSGSGTSGSGDGPDTSGSNTSGSGSDGSGSDSSGSSDASSGQPTPQADASSLD